MIELFLILLTIFLIASQRKLSSRVSSLEKELAAVRKDFQGSPTVLAQAGEAEETSPVARVDEPETATAAMAADAGTRQSDLPPGETNSAPEPSFTFDTSPAREGLTRENLESYLGARWPVWVGGVALALGGVFLVRYSIEAGLLGPGTRLTLAVLFGLVLAAAGEFIRRRGMPNMPQAYSHAMIPGALTAAAAVTLMGAAYAAYGIYGFIGPTTAFGLLALVSFATIALSLLHGQALAGLGLLGSMVTPALVATDHPYAPGLFTFLAISWAAVNAASRKPRWTVVPMLANIGIGFWTIAYTLGVDMFDPLPPALTLIVMLAGTIFFWPGAGYGAKRAVKPGWPALLNRPPKKITLSAAITTVFSAFAFLLVPTQASIDPLFASAAVIAVLAAFGASRTYAVWPALIAAAGAVGIISMTAFTWLDYIAPTPIVGSNSPILTFTHEIATFLLLGAIFTLLGAAFLRKFRATETEFSILWSVLMSGVPVTLGFISFLNFGTFSRDWTHGIYGLALGFVLIGLADWLFRTSPKKEDRIDWPANLAVAGSFAALTLSLHTLTNGIVTTILVSALGFAYLMAGRVKNWPALPWMMAAATLIVFGRIAWQPTIIGPNSLGTTPFFNALLPGYGIPTLLAIIAAFLLRNSPDFRVRNIMQALASLAALMTIAVLVRHAMNGGVLDSRTPTLGEQSIYTLVTIGFSGVLMTLDLKSPSPVFRWGSMLAGAIATLNVLSLHVFALNPFFSGERTGSWPFLNLLLIGYLLPALAYGLVAYLARTRRPPPYVAMLAVAGAVLGFLWATLSVRRFFQGEYIPSWKGFLEAETYAYSVTWLLIGVGLLVLGSRLNAKSLRLASAVLVLVAVVKVFLIDMSNLEGILRALSFIGLGGVLIGIGLFYQRILVNKGGKTANADSRPDPKEDLP